MKITVDSRQDMKDAQAITGLDDGPVTFGSALIPHLPNLLAFARSLTPDHALANDLVQETVLKALRSRSKFIPGTNLRAWLFTILRNTFLSNLRKSVREVALEDEHAAESRVVVTAPQEHALALEQLSKALKTLPPTQRKAILLVGAFGHSYEDAAAMSSCEVGTIKSRVSRARKSLSEAFS